ncbi:ClpX C4-type zinc finger protein [bacterium]|nr:ClpX C4-type zinc finger protein [bacterium]
MREKNKLPKEKNTQDDKNIPAPVYCSFCGRPNTQVIKMVQGPGVNICSECTMIAVQYLIMENKMPSGEAQAILDSFWNKVR